MKKIRLMGRIRPIGPIGRMGLIFCTLHSALCTCLAQLSPDGMTPYLLPMRTNAAAASPYTNVANGLLALYAFGEDTGTTLHDSSGNSYDGTLTTTGSQLPVWTSGLAASPDSPYALTFDGTSSYVSTANYADNLSAFSVCAFFKATAAHEDILLGKVGAGGSSSGTGWFLGMALNDGTSFGQMSCSLQNDGGNQGMEFDSTSTTLNDGNWHQVVMVVSSGLIAAEYIDGAVDGALSYNDSYTAAAGDSNTANVLIGYDGSDHTRIWGGNITLIRIYNRALTATEITDLYHYDKGS